MDEKYSKVLRINLNPYHRVAVELFGIGEMYQDASFENARLLPVKIIDLGKRWVASKKKTSLFLSGNVGSGKSYFSLCLARGLVESGHRWIITVKSTDLDAGCQNRFG